MHATDACLREIVIPDYPIYSACTSAHTPPDELLIGGEWLAACFLCSYVIDVCGDYYLNLVIKVVAATRRSWGVWCTPYPSSRSDALLARCGF